MFPGDLEWICRISVLTQCSKLSLFSTLHLLRNAPATRCLQSVCQYVDNSGLAALGLAVLCCGMVEDELLPAGEQPICFSGAAPIGYPGAEAAPEPASAPARHSDEGEAPQFDEELQAPDPAAPSRGYINRYKEIARLHALGFRNNDICARLGYGPASVSIILKDPFVQAEIARYREILFDGSVQERLKDAARDGTERLHRLILDPNTKDNVALQASTFAIEMTQGKAKQAVSVENNSLGAFMEMLREMRSRSEAPGAVIDMTQAAQPAQLEAPAVRAEGPDKWDTWLIENLPAPA